jgi:phytoene synthase
MFGILNGTLMLLPLDSAPRLVTAPSAHFSVEESYAFCADLARSHYENFPVASLLLPTTKRRHVCAIYAFARVADDFADEPGRTPAERLHLLAEWEDQLRRSYLGDAEHPVFIALAETVREFALPIDLFLALLAAFEQDVSVNRYGSFKSLLEYCSNSANPIGRLVLRVFGYTDQNLFTLSDNICTALQLTNFWQDISVDRENDRLYLPTDEMKKFSYSLDQWRGGVEDENFQNLMQFQIERTEKLFEQGATLPGLVQGRLSYELKFVCLGGQRILQQIRRMKFRVQSGRPALGWSARLGLLLQSFRASNALPGVTPTLAEG